MNQQIKLTKESRWYAQEELKQAESLKAEAELKQARDLEEKVEKTLKTLGKVLSVVGIFTGISLEDDTKKNKIR